jgi:hypothetical protein
VTRTATRRATVGVIAAVLALTVAGGAARASTGPRASTPAPLIPALPPQVEPVTEAVSPVVWQACRAVGLVIGLTAVAGTLAGLPPSFNSSVSDLVTAATGPALTIFFEVCQQIPLPDDPPTCAVDDQVPALPYLGQPVLLAGLLANELRALDTAFTKLGVPLHGALGAAADDLLGCAAGRNPTRAPTPSPTPSASPNERPVRPGITVPTPVSPSLVLPSPAGEVTAPLAPQTGDVAAPLPGTHPVSSSGSTQGRGVALGLLALAVLATLSWLWAGRPRGRTA